jgi:hypothetical protein
MTANKILLLAFIVSLFSSCIKPYTPNIDQNAINKYVVQGMVSSVEGYQSVRVSTTSETSFAVFNPVNGCDVNITDNLGNNFHLEGLEDGLYEVWMDQTELVPGRAYRLSVTTPSNEILISEYDTMPQGPDVMGNLYWEVSSIQTDDPEVILEGVQFYTDFEAGEGDSEYYYWRLTETYEYHTPYPLQFFYSYNGVNEVIPPDYSKMVCYRTQPVQNVFTLSTLNLSSKSYPAFPLNFVGNTSDKLSETYSLLVEQIALSVEAFNFWDKMRINIDQSAGLYTSQPLAVKGNISNTTNSENDVLGFFQASTVTEKRIFVEAPIEGLKLDYDTICNINILWVGLNEIQPYEFPAYLYSDGVTYFEATMSKNCVDCTLAGGVTEKPSYWPN